MWPWVANHRSADTVCYGSRQWSSHKLSVHSVAVSCEQTRRVWTLLSFLWNDDFWPVALRSFNITAQCVWPLSDTGQILTDRRCHIPDEQFNTDVMDKPVSQQISSAYIFYCVKDHANFKFNNLAFCFWHDFYNSSWKNSCKVVCQIQLPQWLTVITRCYNYFLAKYSIANNYFQH